MNEIDSWAIAKYLWGLIVTLFAFLGIRQVDRISKLEEGSVQKTDYDREVDRTREQNKEAIVRIERSLHDVRSETRESFRQVFDRLNEIADRMNK